MEQISRTITIPRPPRVVWRQFASEAALRRWLAPTIEIELEEAGRYRMRGADEATWVRGRVLEIVPEERLVLSWMEEDAGWEHPARLVISLAPDAEGGTTVTLIHDGFAGIGTPTWRGTRDAYQRGIERHRVLEQLADAVLADG